MREGLKVIWDPAIDGGAWPGPVADRVAVVDEAWFGPLRLLDRLELELGLSGLRATSLERATNLAAKLAVRHGWWSASFAADPLGTAQRLLRDRDLLALAGWQGELVGERLDALWQVTADSLPGIAERLHAVAAVLPVRRVGLASITMMSSVAELPRRWQDVFAKLAEAGVCLIDAPRVVASGTGDLANARTNEFQPAGDGSLILLRSHGALAAANEVAASLAALPSLDGVVIIGGDAVLDAALARHGLPRIGTSGIAPASVALVRLVVEAAFEPMEPGDLHALLCLDPGPVPRRVANQLIGALAELPSRRSEEWKLALEHGLAGCDDTWRDDVRSRLVALLPAAAPRDATIGVAEIDHRLEVLASWARARRSSAPSLVSVAALAEEARRLVGGCGTSALSLVMLRRLCDELDRSHAVRVPAQAGLAAVSDPGAVLAPARRIVWWSFTRDSAPWPSRFRLTNEERARLRDCGIVAPDPGKQMEAEAARWRRPLEMATESLVLVCPATSDTGEQCFPHPLWDELRAAMGHAQLASVLEHECLPGVARRRAELRPLPVAAAQVQTSTEIAAKLVLRPQESPSSLESLIGCSFSWALNYHGRLRPGRSSGPTAPSPLLYGKLAHHVLALVFGDGALDADAAAARAHELVDDRLAELCETLALPRYQLERSTVRQAIIAAARELGSLFAATGAEVHGVEKILEGTLGDIGLKGRTDLILARPDAVLDLKWGRSTAYRKLEDGSALQLAIYAHLHGSTPQIGYFTLQTQELLAPAKTTLPGARCVGTATPRETLDGALASIGERRRELAAGQLAAPAADGSEVVAGLGKGSLAIAPACDYCKFSTLCGKGPTT